jgi:hypothetical protein
MKTRLLIGVLGLASTVATTASAEHNHGRPSHFGNRPGWTHDHGHARYVVKYDLHGSRRLHVDSHREAHALVRELEHLGAHAHVDGGCIVHYHMDGNARRRSFGSHRDAHRFESRLEALGFHARVVHD